MNIQLTHPTTLKIKKLALLAYAATIALYASAWSQKGHDVTAYIAEQHLNPTASAAVDSLLEGKSMVYWANWLDNASHNMDHAYTKTWHYKNIDEGVDYDNAPKEEKGDVVEAIKSQIQILSDPNASHNDKSLALKILIHCVGDMHQPMHLGHKTDLGGNKVKLKYFNRDTNLHSIWDSSLLESAHKWSYTEWQQQIDRASAAQQQAITAGTVDDWARQTLAIATQVYKYFQPGMKVMYNPIARWAPVIEQQLLYGGLRLASILNGIFPEPASDTDPQLEPAVEQELQQILQPQPAQPQPVP